MRGDVARILVIEDNPGDSRLIRELLRETGQPAFELECAGRLSNGLQRLAAGGIDVVLLDLGLPDSQGLDTLARCQEQAPDLATVILTGLDDETVAIKAVQQGAQDYLVKGHVTGDSLSRAIRYAIERKRAEEQPRRTAADLARSNEELEQFAYVASHDLQEPLRKILAFGDRLRARCADELAEESLDDLERMMAASQRMKTLINDLLTYSRVASKARPFVPVDLAEVARGVLDDLEVRLEETAGRVELGELPSVEADPTQMRQLLQNLISNALKFHRQGEPPVVRVHARPLAGGGAASGAAGRADGRCQIIVEDNGIGFDESHADRVFGMFQRLHGRMGYEGSGMGLAICRKIVGHHHGSIEATSSPGRGATFIVTLPLKQDKETSTPWAGTEDASASSSRTTTRTTAS